MRNAHNYMTIRTYKETSNKYKTFKNYEHA